ncbi:MAG: site-specific DNA-methyltransferase [Bacteroidales bacterium]|nr:site-specific DNA-methyltransferase [Bacteroidales bacterium]
MIQTNKIYHADCIDLMAQIDSESIDCILTDPPYLYLKNQKLDRPFDETKFFGEAKRILKKNGFIVLFGRGTSFYRWNTILADLGFTFKEEIIWDKLQTTSPLMRLSRVHETISIYTKKGGSINRVKVPYITAKQHDINSIIVDIKRLKTIFNNPKSLDAVMQFLKANKNAKIAHRSDLDEDHVRGITVSGGAKCGDRCVAMMQAIDFGMNEKSIIKETRDHYNYKKNHPTQKPVSLLKRLLNLTTKEGDLVFDPFGGSGSTAVACLESGRDFISCEIDKEYYDKSVNRINEVLDKYPLLTQV